MGDSPSSRPSNLVPQPIYAARLSIEEGSVKGENMIQEIENTREVLKSAIRVGYSHRRTSARLSVVHGSRCREAGGRESKVIENAGRAT
jgi:hypothetical protein